VGASLLAMTAEQALAIADLPPLANS